MPVNDTKLIAHGKWRLILPEFGFKQKQLNGSHQPCPMCGGTDRFRFTDYQGGGEYFCSGCGPGSGFDLLMGVHELTFADAAKKVDEILGRVRDQPIFAPKVDEEKRRQDLNSLWRSANNQEILHSYLRQRGLGADRIKEEWLQDLRGHSGMFLRGSKEKHAGIIALIRNKNGLPISIHRTYIKTKQRKVMPPTENITGASIWLGSTNGNEIVIGEGIETTLSGMYGTGVNAGYAAISANNMENLLIPHNIERAIILADHDRTFTGQKAAFTLARRLDNDGLLVHIVLTEKRGFDYNDVIVNSLRTIRFSNEER